MNSINVLRYLCVWRVNRALVRMPDYLPPEISAVLGEIVAEQLPTRRAKAWRKALNPSTDPALLLPGQTIPDPAWPVEAVLFVYPGKRMYGPGELLFWELKVLGPQADHSFFLEVLLPAMENAGRTRDPRWYQSNGLWGRFDIHAVYAARGPRWEPIVNEGRLDTGYRALPTQWSEGLTFADDSGTVFRRLTWLTPVDLRDAAAIKAGDIPTGRSEVEVDAKPPPTPTLPLLLDALLQRLAQLLPGKHATPGDVWNEMSPDDQTSLWDAVTQANHAQLRRADVTPGLKGQPPGWLGEQQFSAIHPLLLPYLELASILHVGRQTHLGCGTFEL